MDDEFGIIVVRNDMKINKANDIFKEHLLNSKKKLEEGKCYEIFNCPEYLNDRCPFSETSSEDRKSCFHLNENIRFQERIRCDDGSYVEIFRIKGNNKYDYRKFKHEIMNQFQIITSMLNYDCDDDLKTSSILKNNVMRVKAISMYYEYEYFKDGNTFLRISDYISDSINNHAFNYRTSDTDKSQIFKNISHKDVLKGKSSSSLTLLFSEIISYGLKKNPSDSPVEFFFPDNEKEICFGFKIPFLEEKDDTNMLKSRTLIEMFTKQLRGNVYELNKTEYVFKVHIPTV